MSKRDLVHYRKTLPSILVDKVNSAFEERPNKLKNIAFRVVSYVYSRQYEVGTFVPVPYDYNKKLFGRQYIYAYKILENEGILNINHSYIPKTLILEDKPDYHGTGVCKKYKIAYRYYRQMPKLSEEEVTRVWITKQKHSKDFIDQTSEKNTSLKGFSNIEIQYPYKESYADLEQGFIETISSLKIDLNKLKEAANKQVETVKSNDYLIDLDSTDIEDKSFFKSMRLYQGHYMAFNPKSFKLIKENFFKHKNEGDHLFFDDNVIYHATHEVFEQYKKHNCILSYHETIDTLKDRAFYARRNDTNNRLDTNFTNMPNFMLDVIKKDNELESLDMSNSQMALLAHVLKQDNTANKFEDVINFCNLAVEGQVYDYVAHQKNIDRKKAKIGFFRILFDKAGKKSKEKEYLRSVFPNVVGWVDDYKRKNKYKTLAINLQKLEADIFIDGILPLLKQKVTNMVFTKHDSVIYPIKYRQEVRTIVEGYMASRNIKANFKIE